MMREAQPAAGPWRGARCLLHRQLPSDLALLLAAVPLWCLGWKGWKGKPLHRCAKLIARRSKSWHGTRRCYDTVAAHMVGSA
jgi:hypothetical protein